MELDLGHVEDRESFSFKERFDVKSTDGTSMRCDVSVEASVTRTGSRYLLTAAVDSNIAAECSRCLEPFDHRVETGFDLVFQSGGDVNVPEGLEEDDFIFLTQSTEYCYDILPRVREAVLLDLPIRYLCSEECAGICPGCGENLNKAKCSCVREEGDPRWGALKNLLKEQEDK